MEEWNRKKDFDVEGLEIKEIEEQITPEERSLEEWLEIIDKKIAEIEENSKDDNDSVKENNSDKFVYNENELKIVNNQCELCIHNDGASLNKCKRYSEGKPQEVLSNKYKCSYISIQNNVI